MNQWKLRLACLAAVFSALFLWSCGVGEDFKGIAADFGQTLQAQEEAAASYGKVLEEAEAYLLAPNDEGRQALLSLLGRQSVSFEEENAAFKEPSLEPDFLSSLKRNGISGEEYQTFALFPYRDRDRYVDDIGNLMFYLEMEENGTSMESDLNFYLQYYRRMQEIMGRYYAAAVNELFCGCKKKNMDYLREEVLSGLIFIKDDETSWEEGREGAERSLTDALEALEALTLEQEAYVAGRHAKEADP